MFDVLGVLIAFVSVILLLSMLVTAFVQATKSILRLRGRNLLVGVAALLDSLSDLKVDGEGTEADSRTEPNSKSEETTSKSGITMSADFLRGVTRRDSKQRAAKLLNDSRLASVDRIEGENDLLSILAGPRVTWADPDELSHLIQEHLSESQSGKVGKEASKKDNADAAEIKKRVDNLGPALTNRHEFIIRIWTIVWAILVAGLYQVSAPDLISSLAANPERTEQYADQVEDVLGIAESFIGDPRYYAIGYEALDRLAAKFPQHTDLIDQVGIVEGTTQQLVDEVRNVFHGSPDQDTVAAAYEEILADLTGQNGDDGDEVNISDISSQLYAFDIELWGNPDFYVDAETGDWKLDAIVGVFLTAILLTFGAPFWYEQLRTLAALRDPRAQSQNKKSANSTSPITIVETKDGGREITISGSPTADTNSKNKTSDK